MKRIIAIILSIILALLFLCALYIFTRPVDWDAGACGGGYSSYIFNKYKDKLTNIFLNDIDKENIDSFEIIDGTQLVKWKKNKIFVVYDIKLIHKEKGNITLTLDFTGKRLWVDTFKWSRGIEKKYKQELQLNKDVVEIYHATDEDKISSFIKKHKIYYHVTHYKTSDGKWQIKDLPHTYKYRLELTGRMHNAARDSTYIVLCNRNNITFDEAWKPSGFSSNLEDYFKAYEAYIVGQK